MQNSSREDIKKYIVLSIISSLGETSNQSQAQVLANNTAEQMLSQYEKSINKPETFWWGVWKGVVSSFISLFLVGALVVVYVGINTNFWSIAEQAAKAAQQQPIQPNIR